MYLFKVKKLLLTNLVFFLLFLSCTVNNNKNKTHSPETSGSMKRDTTLKGGNTSPNLEKNQTRIDSIKQSGKKGSGKGGIRDKN